MRSCQAERRRAAPTPDDGGEGQPAQARAIREERQDVPKHVASRPAERDPFLWRERLRDRPKRAEACIRTLFSTPVIIFFTHFLPIFPHFSPIFSVWTPGIQRTQPEVQGKTGKNREKSGKMGVIKGLGAPGPGCEGSPLRSHRATRARGTKISSRKAGCFRQTMCVPVDPWLAPFLHTF